MLQRKALDVLRRWKREKTTQALLVMGARQVGKTTAIREFAREEYDSLAELNFAESPLAVRTLAGSTDAADCLLRISALTGMRIDAGRTLLFLDEVQECPELLTWVKFLIEREDLDVIMSGSLLGLDAFAPVRSLPVGFLQTYRMFPLDFEEFCWATGVGSELWGTMRTSVERGEPVPAFLHERLMQQFRRYLLVGGMPDAVQAFCDRGQLEPVRATQRAISDLYEVDVSKYVGDAMESRQIRMVYEAIPGQLNTPSKRFTYARLGKNLRFANMETAFDWLSSAGVAIEATRVGEPIFPLGVSEDRTSFKLFMNDVGLLTSQLMGTASIDILNGDTSINYGSIFENIVAQELIAHGFRPHYYSSKKRGEVDFVVEDPSRGASYLIEVKSGKDYKRHSALTNVLETYAHDGSAGGRMQALVLCDGNVSRADDRLYLPVYAIGLLARDA